MAEDSEVQGLCEETTCPICLEYFKDPVTIDCGHNFCRACLLQCWEETHRAPSCPQCRETVQQKNLRSNRQLASIVEIAKKFSLRRHKGGETLGLVCERHQEPLKLFCQDDQTPICVVCDKAKEHRGHKVIPKEEAFEEYQLKGQAYLEFLKKEREAIWSSQQSGDAEGRTLLEQTERERQKIMAEFRQLQQFLEAQEHHVLSKLKDMDDQIKDMWNAHIDKLSEEISAVDLLIKEMEDKQKQPASEFLQGLGNMLQRCNKEKFVNPITFPCKLKQQIQNVSKIHPFLDTTMNEFKEIVLAGPEAKEAKTDRGTCTDPTVVLSMETCVVPTLALSTDCSYKLFSLGAKQQYSSRRNSYQNASRFSCWSYVMGFERINSGRFSWLMNTNDEKFCAVGVALECFRGRDVSKLTPEVEVWAVGKSNGRWYAFTSDLKNCLSWDPMVPDPVGSFNATAIRFSLNYEQGSVTFLNAVNNTPLYTFCNASFLGQPVSSWFLMSKSNEATCSGYM